ncbi:MAG: aspartate/glutamate racemase family protein [Rhizobiaceae bacterium]|nr:aspartate/glutamate racemase family protein [Rhizobiaceae bacterium]MBL4696155.1 aspartate/glutamate racemase family protein [Rhizobiaceae bacterium]
MHILIINPNSTSAMTSSIAEAAEKVTAPGTVITAVNPPDGPPSIQGPQDGEDAWPGLSKVFEERLAPGHPYDAVIIACFDDTGLLDLKARTTIPVLGIGEAAFHAAMMLGGKFSVVTTLSVSVPVIEENIERYGYANRCAKVRASGVPVLDLEDEGSMAETTIRNEAEVAIREDQCDVVVLGCAGMADLAASMSQKFNRPVVDGVAAAIVFCEGLIRMGNTK